MGALSLLPTPHTNNMMTIIHHHFFRSPSPPALFSLFLLQPLRIPPPPLSFPASSLLSRSLPSSTPRPPTPLPLALPERQSIWEAPIHNVESSIEGGDDDDDFGAAAEAGIEEFEGIHRVLGDSVSIASTQSVSELPALTVKERKELSSYAHGLGKKLKSQQVGKLGVTDSVVNALVETLEANELLKLKIHNSCPGEMEDVVKQLESATKSVVVSQIGRAVILYRPSLTKLKAEEKKRQNQRLAQTIQSSSRPLPQGNFPNKGQVTRFSNRGRRGSSRI